MNECAVCHRTEREVQVQYCTKYGEYLCSKHKNQFLRHGRITDGERAAVSCAICHKAKQDGVKVHWCSLAQKYLCLKHRSQYNRLGKFISRTKRDENEYILHDDYAEIVFRDASERIVCLSQIDIEDVERCKHHKWYVTETMGNTRYVKSVIDGTNTSLHRFILNTTDKNPVDHIDKNGLNNRKHNLRVVTYSENSTNSKTRSKTGQKNIYFKKDKYQVQIIRNYKNVYNKTFGSLECAIKARDKFIEEYNKTHGRCV